MSFPSAAALRFGPTALAWVAAVAFVLMSASAARGLITGAIGNDPVADNQWPAGSVDLANLKTRVGWWEGPPFGGGQYSFLYRGDTAAFQQALDAFAKVKAPGLRVVVHEGPHDHFYLKIDRGGPKGADAKVDPRVDWTFTVWNAESYNRLYNNPTSVFSAIDPSGAFRNEVDPPRVDVYVGGAADGRGVDWSKVKVPAGVAVTDERASANGYPAGTGSVVRGEAYDMVTSKPVAGMKLSVQKHVARDAKTGQDRYDEVAAATADADGRFELAKVAAGTYRVVASAEGYASRVLGQVAFGSDTLKQYVVRLAPPATMAGTVVDGDGKPVAGVSVRADAVMGMDGRAYPLPTPREAKTDAAGRFVIDGLPRGYCQLFASAEGYLGADVLKVYAVPTDGLTVRVTGTGTVRGKVTRTGGGVLNGSYLARLVPEGGEKVGSWSGSTTVAADGTFAFDGVPAGKYFATVRPNPGPAVDGKDPNEQAVEVRAGRTAELTFAVK